MRLPTVVLAALALPLLASPASGSLLEAASGGAVAYQFDADSHHDAPDGCREAAPGWGLPLFGSSDGLLVPPDDWADAYVLDIPAGKVGQRIRIEADAAAGSPDVALTTYAPGCLGTVLDPFNQPTPPPSPPAPGPGEATHEADRVQDPFVCRDDAWLFVVTRLEGRPAPSSIHVAWTDGTERPVALDWSNPQNAVYATDHNTGILLKGAWANLPDGWDGDFLLAAGPCDAVDGGAVYGEPNSGLGGLLAFTPVRAGPHVVVVTLAQAAQQADDYADLPVLQVSSGTGGPAPPAAAPSPLAVQRLAGDAATGLARGEATVPLPGPGPETRSCHFCAPQVQQVVERASYVLRSFRA